MKKIIQAKFLFLIQTCSSVNWIFYSGEIWWVACQNYCSLQNLNIFFSFSQSLTTKVLRLPKYCQDPAPTPTHKVYEWGLHDSPSPFIVWAWSHHLSFWAKRLLASIDCLPKILGVVYLCPHKIGNRKEAWIIRVFELRCQFLCWSSCMQPLDLPRAHQKLAQTQQLLQKEKK